MKKTLLSFLLLTVACCFSLRAQVTTSSIGGHVVGDEKQPLAGVVVKAVHLPTGTTYYTTSMANGRYLIGGMRVGGPYTIDVEYMGYNADRRTGVQLALGEEASFDFTLTQSATNIGEVVVSGTNNPVFSASRTGSEEIITSQTMLRMPAINRSLSDYTRLTPASNGTSLGNSYGGVSGRYNNVTVDGASFNNSFGLSPSLGASGIEPVSLESIEQIQVMISPFDVRNGGFTGGGVNSVTRSGSNDWQASAYSYFKGSKLEGLKQGEVTDKRGTSTGRLYGVNVGGPILQNKLFFFVNGEIERQGNAISYRPAAPGETSGGSIASVTTNYMQQIRNYLSPKYGYDPGSYLSDRPSEGTRVTTRLDWNINTKNTLSIKYFYLNSFNTIPPSTSGATGSTRGPNDKSIPFQGSYYRTNNNFNIVMADLNTRVSDRLQNVLTVGYSALRDFRDWDCGDFPMVDILGDNNTYTVTTFGTEANSYNNLLNTNIWQIQDNLTWVVSDHTFTFGVQGDLRNFKNGFSQNYPGSWKFASWEDFCFNAEAMDMYRTNPSLWTGSKFDVTANFQQLNDLRTQWRAVNSAVNGVPVDYQQTYATGDEFPYAFVRVMQWGAYLQDRWSVRPNLHLTYGVRFDVPIFLSDVGHNQAFDGVAFADGQTIDTGHLPKTRVSLSPRVGFNWDVFDDRMLQLRGGAGLFQGTPPYVWISNQAGNNGLLFGKLSYSGTGSSPTSQYAGFSGDINNINYLLPNGKKAAVADIAVTDEHFKYPKLFKGSIAADWRFWDDWILTGEFLYSKNINDIYHQNINLKQSGWVNDRNDATLQERPYYAGPKYSSSALSVIKLNNTSEGYAAYTTFKLQKSFRDGVMRGLQVAGSYTFGTARAVTDGSSSVAYSAWRYRPAIDPNAIESGYTLGAFKNRVLVTASYRKEYGKHFASSIGVVYDRYSPSSSSVSPRYSYTYNGDVNGDGDASNDLIYIPRTEREITLAPNATYTTAHDMWLALDAFIEQDAYLKEHRGQYATRNGATVPVVNRIDLNFTQDFFLETRSGQRNTIRMSVDIRNFGNLLNKDWGIMQKGTLGNQQFQFLQLYNTGKNYTGSTPYNGSNPEFVFVNANAGGDKLTKSYMDWVDPLSRWGIQIGIKYIFN